MKLLLALGCLAILCARADAGDSCPNVGGYSRMVSPIDADYFGAGHRVVDPTSFDDVMGTSPRWPDQHHPFPGHIGGIFRFDVPDKQYVSMKFTFTQDALNAPTQNNQALWGRLMMGEDGVRPMASMTISKSCGDFGQAGSVLPGCKAIGFGADGGIVWATKASNQGSVCVISSPGTYYLNVIQADITKPAAPVSYVPDCQKLMGEEKMAKYPTLCHTLEMYQFGNYEPSPAYDGVAQNGGGSGSGGGSGNTPPPSNNALACQDEVMIKKHIDFFSPMPPSCSQQGLSAGAECNGGETCPLP